MFEVAKPDAIGSAAALLPVAARSASTGRGERGIGGTGIFAASAY